MTTNYQLNQREQMNKYLDSLKEEAIRINGDESVIWLAKDFLTLLINKLAQQNKVLEVPDCCPNNGSQGDFHVVFTWDKNKHYLECEIPNSGILEFFYRNHLTKEVWSYETDIEGSTAPFSRESEIFLDKLSLFVE
jgi:hypothetical protein